MKTLAPNKSLLQRFAEASHSGTKIIAVCDSFNHCKAFCNHIVYVVFQEFLDGGHVTVGDNKDHIKIDIGKGSIILTTEDIDESDSKSKYVRLTK